MSLILNASHLDKDTIKSIAQETIHIEHMAISKLSDYIDQSFVDVVQLIYKSNGRVVVTGIGKSAIIGQKIVATMNSTGTPALFMHAADAVHGDLGMIQKEDVVIAISKSGNTPEIKALAPLIKNYGNTLVAMVGNTDSMLATSADYILCTKVDKEACPNNLAPTTSTTVQLVMGDALAVALLKIKNFTSGDFSKYHPGGALGKQLYLTMGAIAEQNAKPLVPISATIKEVIVEISAGRMGATAVTNGNDIVGIITDGDIRRMLDASYSNLSELKAENIMGKNPSVALGSVLAKKTLPIYSEKGISQLIVLDERKVYLGMVHIHDLNREGIL